MAEKSLEEAVLAVVKDPGYQPVKPRGIAKKLKLDEDETRELKRVIKRLVKRGLLHYGANHLVQPKGAGPKDNYRVTGIFRRAEAGYGFVRPAGSARGPTASRTFISPPRTPAMLRAATRCWCG